MSRWPRMAVAVALIAAVGVYMIQHQPQPAPVTPIALPDAPTTEVARLLTRADAAA